MLTPRLKKALERIRHATIDEASGVVLAAQVTSATCACCGDLNIIALNKRGEMVLMAIMPPEGALAFARELEEAARAALLDRAKNAEGGHVVRH